MEGREPDRPLAGQHRSTIVLREHVDRLADRLDRRRPDEHPGNAPPGSPPPAGRPRRSPAGGRSVPAGDDVDRPQRPLVGPAVEDVPGEHDGARARPEHRRARRRQGRVRAAHAGPRCRAGAESSSTRRPGSPARPRPASSSGPRTSVDSTPSASSISRCSRNAPWRASTPTFISVAPLAARRDTRLAAARVAGASPLPLRRVTGVRRIEGPSAQPIGVAAAILTSRGRRASCRAWRSRRPASPSRDRATPWRRSGHRRSAWSPRRSPSP